MVKSSKSASQKAQGVHMEYVCVYVCVYVCMYAFTMVAKNTSQKAQGVHME